MNDSQDSDHMSPSLASYNPLINRVLESRYRIDEEVGRGGSPLHCVQNEARVVVLAERQVPEPLAQAPMVEKVSF